MIRKFINKIREYIYNTKNVIQWLPVIWNDSNFDQSYLYKIIYFKLKNMEEFFRSDNAISADALKTAHEIMITKNLAKRLSEGNYLSNALTEHEKIYKPNYKFEFEPCEDNPKLRKLVDRRPKSEQDSFSRCGKLADYLEKQDKEMLFNLMSKKIEGWWD